MDPVSNVRTALTALVLAPPLGPSLSLCACELRAYVCVRAQTTLWVTLNDAVCDPGVGDMAVLYRWSTVHPKSCRFQVVC
jgi:hypothetical protein